MHMQNKFRKLYLLHLDQQSQNQEIPSLQNIHKLDREYVQTDRCKRLNRTTKRKGEKNSPMHKAS